MSVYTCQRCGQESRCGHSDWANQHPVAAVALAAFAIMFTLVVVVGHPWLLLVGAVGAVVYVIDREYRRRRALAARADWEFRRLMEQPVLPAAWSDLKSDPSRPKRRPRGADDWSPTEPISGC